MTSFLNKNIFINKDRSISISFDPKDNLLNNLKMSEKKNTLRNHIKRYTSDNTVNQNQSNKLSYKKLFEKKKTLSRNNEELKLNNSSFENEITFPSTIKNNDSNIYLRSDSKKHSFFKPTYKIYKKYSIFSKKIKIDLKKGCIKKVIERNKMDRNNYTFDEIKKKVLKNYTPNLAKNELSITTNEPTEVQSIDNINNTFYRKEKSLNTYASPTQNRRKNFDIKFKSNRELITLKKIGNTLVNANKIRYSIDYEKFPSINLENYFFKKEARKKGKIKALKELKAISNLLTEYEELNKDKGAYSQQNLNRIIDLLKLKEFDFNEFEMNNPKEVKRDKITPETEEGCYILTAISRIGPPPFLKTKFKSKTISKYNDSMGFGFGSTRNKNNNVIREKVHTLKYKVE